MRINLTINHNFIFDILVFIPIEFFLHSFTARVNFGDNIIHKIYFPSTFRIIFGWCIIMQIFRIFFRILAAIFGTILVIGFFLPSTTEVSRQTLINKEIQSVFSMVNNYREFNKWSPWAKRDEKTIYEFTGAESGVGAKMSWKSQHPQVGTGNQEIIESIDGERIRVKLQFQGQGDAFAEFRFAEQDNKTEVIWMFETHHGMNLLGRYFGLFFDSLIGPDYEAGLTNLKNLLEKK